MESVNLKKRSKFMKYHFIINPCAGGGKAWTAWHQVQTALAAKPGIQFDHATSQYAGHPRELAIQAVQRGDCDCLVVVGGDGTLHEVITGLIATQQEEPLPVGYIPAGTGNDFARGYGIATEPRQALDQILTNQHPHWINIGHYHDFSRECEGIFLNNFGIGFDAAIVHATNHSWAKAFLNRHHLGTFAYIYKAVRVFFAQPAFRVVVDDDGHQRTFNHAFLLVASNHPYISGGVRIAADQRIDRRELELVVVEKRHWLTLLWAMLMFASGQLVDSRFAHLFRGTQLRYAVTPAQYGQIDGDEPGKHPFDLALDCCSYPLWQTPLW